MSKPPREKIGSFLVDSATVLVGEPCHLVPGEGKAPLVTYDRLKEMFHEQGRAWTEPAIAAGGVEVVPAAERRERAAVAAIPAPGGGTAGLAISVGYDGWCRVYLERDDRGDPERIIIEIGYVEP
jgi:hypothetical protein